MDLASTRRSIRKYTGEDIPLEDIEYFIKAAVNTPSGCNSQCWRFVAIRDTDIIKQIDEAVAQKIESIMATKRDELPREYLSSKRKMVGFFAKAPVVIAVFKTAAGYYDPLFISALKDQGYDDEGIMRMYGNYDILSIGAAIQNMLLAIHEKGYGACWMNDPAVAGTEINEILSIPLDQKFISLVPVGVPAYIPRNKKLKDMREVFSVL